MLGTCALVIKWLEHLTVSLKIVPYAFFGLHCMQVARHIKITHEESPYFGVACLRPAGSKVAPGMETTYVITFTPDEKKVGSLQWRIGKVTSYLSIVYSKHGVQLAHLLWEW